MLASAARLLAVAIAAPSSIEAAAPERRVVLEWVAPPGCPSQDEVTARAEELLLASDGSVAARAEIVAATPSGFELAVVVAGNGTDATYRHVAEDCVALGEIAALFVAVAADPLAAIAEARVEPPPQPPAAVLPAREQNNEVDDAPVREATRLGGWIRIHGLVGFAQLPQLDAGVGFAGAIAYDRVRVELSYSHLFARERGVPGLAPASASVSADDFALRGCVELGRRRVRFGGCLGPELGAVTGLAHNVDVPGRHTALWVAATAGPVLRWIATERLQLHLGIDGVLALRRPGFALQDDTSARITTQRGGVRAVLGLAMGFGRERMRAGHQTVRRRRS